MMAACGARRPAGRARAHGPRGRALRWLLALCQLCAVVASFQLSAVGHFVSDIAQVIAVGHHQHDGDADSDEDDPGHECPPGCPNCHHVHLSGASLPPAAFAVSFLPAAEASAPSKGVGDEAPPAPQLPSVYRPPRA
jgi:hypothetical protein